MAFSYRNRLSCWAIVHASLLFSFTRGTAQMSHAHDDSALALAISPDRTLLASGNSSGLVELWDLPRGKRIGVLHGHHNEVYGLGFCPDGKTIATADLNGEVYFWNVATQTQVSNRRLKHEGGVHCLAWAPDGRTIATGNINERPSVFIWDARDGKLIHSLHKHKVAVNGLAYSPDSSSLLSAGDEGSICLWDVHTGEEIRMVTRGTHPVNAIALSADGQRLAAATGDERISIYELRGIQKTITLSGHPGIVTSMVFTQDGKTLIAAGDCAIDKNTPVAFWDLDRQRARDALSGHGWIRAIALGRNGDTLITASNDPQEYVEFWSTQNLNNPSTKR